MPLGLKEWHGVLKQLLQDIKFLNLTLPEKWSVSPRSVFDAM